MPPFKILSLNGGGTRGIFQAVFLSRLQKELGRPLWQQFDLIAGTSTGSIVALAIALNVEINRVVDLYRHHSGQVFRPKPFCGFRKGPRYDQQVLRKLLGEIFGNRQLRNARCNIIATASCLDQFSHRVFCSFPSGAPADSDLMAVDVVLSSSAAPTYFAAMKPSTQERSYIDGGLWANSPSLVAVLWANCHLNIPIPSIRLLSIGTGDFPRGLLNERFCNMLFRLAARS
jgi:patatin-like phospholipase/acyl hydrolase